MTTSFFTKLDYNFDFIKVSVFSKYFPLIIETFKGRLESYYGNQDEAITKIQHSEDRVCEVLVIDEEPLGFIVYKTELQSEYGIENSFEFKTLMLFDPMNQSGKGYGSILMERVLVLALKLKAESVFCTCGLSNKKALKFFQKFDFKIQQEKIINEKNIELILVKTMS